MPRFNGFIFMTAFVANLMLGVVSTNVLAQHERPPLAPLKLDTPRDSFRSYWQAILDYQQGLKNNNPQLLRRLDDAVRTFDLQALPLLTRADTAARRAILLKEVLDRVIVIDLSKIPDNAQLLRWRLKDTEVTILKTLQGSRQGEFLFSSDTVARVEEFYHKVKHLPYLEGTTRGAGYTAPLTEQYLSPAWKKSFFHIERWKYAALLLAIFLGLVLKLLCSGLVHWLQFFIKAPAVRRVLQTLEKPLGLLGATVFWFLAIQFIQFEGKFLSFLVGVVQLVLSGALIWCAYRLTDIVGDYLKQLTAKTQTDLDDHLVPLAVRSLRIFLVLMGVLFALQNLGINIVSVLAGLGLGGLAFALAAKDAAANLFGSIMILIDRPFKVGDWIKTPNIEGTVEDIGFRSTRVRTFYNSLVSVPNSALANANIDNMGLRRFRRVKAELGLVYSTPLEKMQKFIHGVRKIILSHPDTVKDNFHVYFNSYGDSSLNIMLYYFLQVPDWSAELRETDNIYQQIFSLAHDTGIEFAFPTRTLHIEKS